MGTLFDQPPRQESLDRLFSYVERKAREIAVKADFPTNAEYHVACDMIRTALAVQSADVLDEQLGGFGHILERIADSLEKISDGTEA